METPIQSVSGQLWLYNTKANSTKVTTVVQIQKVKQHQHGYHYSYTLLRPIVLRVTTAIHRQVDTQELPTPKEHMKTKRDNGLHLETKKIAIIVSNTSIIH